MRTYSRSEWLHADKAWRALMAPSQLPRWKPYREAAALRGFIYPPVGARGDSWGDRQLTPWAIVARELYDGIPARLMAAIAQSWSWSQVVARIVRQRDDVYEDTLLREKDAAWERAKEPTHAEAAMSVGAILRRMADSMP